MRACYNDALKAQPNLTVVVRVTLVIASNGTVKSLIDAGSTRTDPQVSACVQTILRGLVFDGAANETTVTIPLKFTPQPLESGKKLPFSFRLDARREKRE